MRIRSPKWLWALALLSSAGALAAPSVRLEYLRDAPACPDEDSVRAGIAARLGYPPFDPFAHRRIRARVSSRNRELEGTVESFDESGRSEGVRRIRSAAGDCGELAQSMELAIAIAIDPLVLSRPALSPPPPPPLVPSPPPPRPLPPRPAADRAIVTPRNIDTARAELGLNVLGSAGAEPSPSLGLDLSAAVRWYSVSVGLELRADLPTSAAVGSGSVTGQVALGMGTLCLRGQYVGGCGVAGLGVMIASGSGSSFDTHRVEPYLVAGGRLLTDFPLGAGWFLRLQGDLFLAPAQAVLLLGSSDVWTSSWVTASFGVGLVGVWPTPPSGRP